MEGEVTQYLFAKKEGFERSEHREIPPAELSGDEHDEGSLLMSMGPPQKSNFLLTVTTILKSTIGGGIIALPYTISRLGIIMSIVLFVVFGLLNQLSSILLLKSKNLCGHSNYATIMHAIWTNNASKFTGSVIIFLDNLGVCIMEIIILKVSVRKIAEDISGDKSITDNWYLNQAVVVLVLALIELPLTLSKKIEKLKIVSFLGVAGIVVFMACLVIHYLIKRSEGFGGMEMDMWPPDWIEAFAVMPNIVLAYSFQMNYFPVYKGLKDSTDSKMNWASAVGTLACGVSYILVGFVGYSLAGRKAQANFLQSIEYGDTSTSIFVIMNVGYLLSIMFSFTILFFGCRNNFVAMMNIVTTSAPYRPRYHNQGDDDANMVLVEAAQPNRAALKRRKNVLFYVYTMVIYLIIVVLSYLLDDIEVILNFLGAICQNLLAIILPCLFYLVLIQRMEKKRRPLYYLSLFLIIAIPPYSVWNIVANYL